MRDHWVSTTLGALCATGGLLQTGPFGSQLHAEDYVDEGVPVVMPTNIGVNRVVEDRIARVREEDAVRLERHRLAEGDIVYSRRGDVTKRALIRRAERGWLCGTGCLLVRPGADVDPRWLSYWLGAPWTHDWIKSHAVGATMPNLNTSILAAVPVSLPPLGEQRRIADVLDTVEDAIAAEEGCVRKMDDLCAALGHQLLTRVAPLGEAPLSDLADISKGYSYKSRELQEGGGWLVNLKNVGRDGSFQARGFKPLVAAPKAAQNVDNGDILVAQTDLTQNREVIGRPVRVRRGLVQGTLTASLDLVIVRPGPDLTREYLFAVLNSPEFRAHALGYCNGTTVVHMGARAVPTYMAPLFPPEILATFTARVRLLRDEADASFVSALRLQGARDELLPMLLSGRAVPEEVAA